MTKLIESLFAFRRKLDHHKLSRAPFFLLSNFHRAFSF